MKRLTSLLFVLVILAMVAACAPATPAPAPTAAPPAAAPTEAPPAPEPTEAPPAEAKHPALADNKITIAWIPKALNNPVFEIGKVGAETKAAELTQAGPIPVEIVYTASVQSDIAEQTKVMEDVIAKGVDAIGVSCNDPTGCEDPIKKALDAGVEVMTWDSDSPDSGRFTYLGVDNYEGGKAAADLLVKAMGETGKVALLTGVPGAFNLEERIRGFKDGVAAYPDIEIVTTVACNDDINKGVQVVEETMQAYPDLNGWFFVGLWPLFADKGSMPLWEAAAKSGDLKTIAFDTLPVELEYVQDGYLQGLVGQKYWGWGYDTVQMIYDKIVNGKTFESFTNSGMDLVDKCNADVMAEMWEKQDFTITLPPLCEAGAVAGAVTDAMTKQADPNNHFPNGIGEVDCKGVNLVVATQTGPQIASPVENFWKEWGDKTGGTVEVQTFPFGDLFAKIRTGYLSGSSPFDIIIYASDWAGDIMGPGYVLEVPKKYQDMMGYDYLIPTYRDRILAWGGKTYAAPYDGDSHMIYYRADLLNDPTHQAAFKAQFGYDLPAPPKTWQQYLDIATYFQGKTIDGQTVYGAGTAFKPKAQSYWTFLGVAASYAKAPDDPGYFFDPDTMEPRINNPGFVEALNTYIALSKVGPPDVLNWDVGNIRSGFPAGQVVLGIDWGDVGPLASDPNASVVVGKWGSALEPGVDKYWDSKKGQWVEEYNQAPFLAFGGWVQSVSTTTKSPECALDFISFMGNQNMSALLVTTAGSGVNPHYFSDGNNLEPWLKVGMTEAQAKEYLGAVTDILAHPNAVVDLRITGAAEYFDTLDTQLARAVAGEVDAQGALDQVAKDWNAITDRLGRDQQKTLYRQQLGLPTD